MCTFILIGINKIIINLTSVHVMFVHQYKLENLPTFRATWISGISVKGFGPVKMFTYTVIQLYIAKMIYKVVLTCIGMISKY